MKSIKVETTWEARAAVIDFQKQGYYTHCGRDVSEQMWLIRAWTPEEYGDEACSPIPKRP